MKGFFAASEIQSQRKDPGLLPKCGSCGLYKQCQSPKMPVYGQGAKKVLVVGEAPGATEDEEGRPFVGKAGEYLRNTLSSLGVSLDRDAWTTNALICRPPNNTTPNEKQISWCRPNLLSTIKETQPWAIITLGRPALVSVIEPYWQKGVRTLEQWVGWKIPLNDFWIFPTWHPSYLLRSVNPLLGEQFYNHLEAAFEITHRPPTPLNLDTAVDILYEENDIINAIQALNQEGGWVAVDYETNCLKPEYPKAKLVSCALSNGKRTVSFLVASFSVRHALREFLRSKNTRKISSNLKMEERWSQVHLQTPVKNWGWDTMIAAHVLDNRPGITSIKFQAFIRMGIETYNANVEPYLESKDGHYNRIFEIDTRTLLKYGGIDALLEWHVARQQRKELGYQ